jgi:hypothetical protein
LILSCFIVESFVFLLLDFASNDVNEIVHAYFNCPRKLRPKYKRIKSHIATPAVKVADQ